ncbi:hypothetical protein TREMEDRAFT_62296 [Tremella mesenterica DSM 1558]|uniref:uncharacterized protein n=1 Tax=Tremella mesenterica (strain ATCC 24925 / CBS 8224 / DSM 1558 / NBRC 9311 / NRRL Y-6157 / RJB 2259-6 / UBC 559-6) TaxID=578456 RepID=UPI0003F49897|nr:uncharacterized protein TREMEDRAFT_62296 [Tremella mesenterica DSM 1558]EIW69430.1 hypothetical protein TREMEDRAFT_62296 [Tremella mesenterica DSM 1558]
MSHSSNTTIPSDYSDISTTTAKKFKYPSYKRFNGVPSWNHKLPQPKGFHTTYQKNHTRKSPPYALFLYFTSLERQHPSKQYSVASPPSHAYNPPEYPKFNSVSNSNCEELDVLQDYSSCEDIEMFEEK